ncbi:unnamed protein product [Parnassius mnemosyne]|uniref:Uncharacterized protein n=1 Tax=Parnassius mnemosyne TaxID=213953 RepID=A0AAV1MA81_9NEOP
MVKATLIDIVRQHKQEHCDKNNKTFKMTEVKKLFEEGLQHITPEKWSSCVSHIIKEEDKIYGLDHMIDNVSDRFIINVTESDSDDFLSDDE